MVRIPECSLHKGLEEQGRARQSTNDESAVDDQSGATLGRLRIKHPDHDVVSSWRSRRRLLLSSKALHEPEPNTAWVSRGEMDVGLGGAAEGVVESVHRPLAHRA